MTRPLLILSIVLVVLAFGVDLGKSLLPAPPPPKEADLIAAMQNNRPDHKVSEGERDSIHKMFTAGQPHTPPGLGVPYLAFLDVLLIYTAWQLGSSELLPGALVGKTSGVVTLIVMFLLIVASFVGAIVALVKLFVMLGLFLAAPFGTIAYLAVWGFFDTGTAAVVLGTSLFFKLGFLLCLLVVDIGFLKKKFLMTTIGLCLVGNLLLSFLHGFVPGILVSIVDDVGAIVIAVLAIIWALVILIRSILSILKLRNALAGMTGDSPQG